MNLQTATLQSPGTLGLNTEQQDDILDPRYATVALNCVIDRNGRLAARNGYSLLQNTAADAGGTPPTFEVLHSYVTSSGTDIIIGAGGNRLWDCSTNPPTDITGSLTITDDNWQFANFEGEVYAYQDGHDPAFWAGSGNFALITSKATDAGIVQGKACMSAFGRMWVVDPDETTLRYSDLLIPEDFSGGSAGSIDLYTVWTGGDDRIVGLAVHNNNLIIFCENTIVIYDSADDIGNLALNEVIDSTGCLARDSIQNIGQDILYLSKEGIRSLGRTVLQDNMPMQTLSANIREDIALDAQFETGSLIRSAYNERNGFYVIIFPTVGTTYVLDLRMMRQGIVRPTNWDVAAKCYVSTVQGDLLMGLESGFIGKYGTYQDNTSPYVVNFKTGWIDQDGDAGEIEYIWKKMRVFLGAEFDTDVTATWDYDYGSGGGSLVKSITGGATSEYNVAQYNIDEYGSQISAATIDYQMSKTGSLVRAGIQAEIDNGKLAFNKIVLYFKAGNRA
jgi:hypothetical protein